MMLTSRPPVLAALGLTILTCFCAPVAAQSARHHVESIDPGTLLQALTRTAPTPAAATPQAGTAEPPAFVNWESPQTHPLDLTPDGQLLLAVNTADNRLEVFDVGPAGLTPRVSIPVGLDPVSVRAHGNTEAWVINRISDSVSIVDLAAFTVRATLPTGNEPADVVFAGQPERAFVSVSQANAIHVFDPADLAAPALEVPIQGEHPRALATDGTRVYAAIFNSGNKTTLVPFFKVDSPANPYPGDLAPPPNVGLEFSPPIAVGLPPAPATSLIVKGTPGGWLDDNGANWSAAVNWNLVDNDIAVLDAGSLSVGYVKGVMNHDMALALDDAGQTLFVVGTDAINHVRFEPNLNGIFVRAVGALVPTDGGFGQLQDLNPHLDYSTPMVPQDQRDLSIGDPRGVAWSADGATRYVTGMGSNNVLALGDEDIERVDVGQGPTGIVRDAAGDRLYVLNRFDASISVLGTAPFAELQRTTFFDPTPAVIRDGRPFLYDTHRTSGLGQASCGSCHVDGRADQLAWDLGDPSGAMGSVPDEACQPTPITDVCAPHPMKGPMTTQTLIGALGVSGPLHWRGDRDGLEAFNPAFVGLLGDDVQLTGAEMERFVAFGRTLMPPPNPYRLIDGSLPSTHPNGGNPLVGEYVFHNTPSCPATEPVVTCNFCHATPETTSGNVMSFEAFTGQPMKHAPLKATYEKLGFSRNSTTNTRGFGLFHDGVGTSLAEDLADNFPDNVQVRLDIEAYVNSIATDTHAGVGQQVSVDGTDAAALARRDLFVDLVAQQPLGLVVKGLVHGTPRGFYFDGTHYQSDRAAQALTMAQLDANTDAGSPLTYTLVPLGSEVRIGVDRDEDGHFDRDELDAGSDPADPLSTPDGCDASGSTDLGFALAGTGGLLPDFSTCGVFSSGHTADLLLQDARPNAPAYLLASPDLGHLPFLGGTLVPQPEFILGPVFTDGDGSILLLDLAGGDGPLDVAAQWAIQDAGGPQGYALSNALMIHLLP